MQTNMTSARNFISNEKLAQEADVFPSRLKTCVEACV